MSISRGVVVVSGVRMEIRLLYWDVVDGDGGGRGVISSNGLNRRGEEDGGRSV